MKKFIAIFDCGRIELNLARSVVYFVVTKLQDITDKVIPFFDKSPAKQPQPLWRPGLLKVLKPQIMQILKKWQC